MEERVYYLNNNIKKLYEWTNFSQAQNFVVRYDKYYYYYYLASQIK